MASGCTTYAPSPSTSAVTAWKLPLSTHKVEGLTDLTFQYDLTDRQDLDGLQSSTLTTRLVGLICAERQSRKETS